MKKAILFLLLIGAMLVGAQHFSGYGVLVVDKDTGLKFRNPDNPEIYIGYEYNLIKSLNSLGFSDANKNIKVTTAVPTAGELKYYAAVFVVCGPRAYTEEILTSTEFQNLYEYLEGYGGCLYMEGNNIAHFLTAKNPEFLNRYFNNKLSYDGGTTYTGYDTIITDSTSSFCRPYTFIYPSGTAPDYSVDGMEAYDPGITAPNYYSVLIPGEKQGKLYKSTATAYTPPATKDKAPQTFKTFMQTTVFGAYSYPVRKQTLPDSIENQLERTSYLRDIMRFFTIGKTLIVKDDGEVRDAEKTLVEVMSKIGLQFDLIEIPSKGTGPNYAYYIPYTTVIWFTGQDPFTISPTDTTALGTYLTFGGNIIMSGDDIAQDLGIAGVNERGTEFPFLEDYFAVDFISSKTDDNEFVADRTSPYYSNDFTKSMSMSYATTTANDLVLPYLRGTYVDTAFYERSSVKAPVSVGVINRGVTNKSVFLGFAFEYLKAENLSGFIEVTFRDVFNYDLIYEPQNNTSSSDKNRIDVSKDIAENSLVSYSGGFLFIENIFEAKLIDAMGRNIMNLNSGYNDIRSGTKSGVYFVVGKCNGEIFRKSFVKL
ncbi:MAG: hypothetical protein PHW02_03935 [bacterium]|nr:hypothetical protein [bacterium]